MPFANGVFSRLYSWVNDKANGFGITASRMDSDTNDIVGGLNALPLAVQAGQYVSGLDTGAQNAIAVTLQPAPTALTNGMTVWVKAAFAVTGPATLKVNGFGPYPIQKFINGALTALSGVTVTAGQWLPYIFDATNTVWQFNGPQLSNGGLCQLRLGLISGNPEITNDVSTTGIVYATPFGGNIAYLPTNGGAPVATALAEQSNVLGNSAIGNAGPAAAAASSMYDFYLWTGGLTRSVPWKQSGAAVTGCTAGSGPVYTTSAAHGLAVGDLAHVGGIQGLTSANGSGLITAVGSATTFTIGSFNTVGTYSSGGSVASRGTGVSEITKINGQWVNTVAIVNGPAVGYGLLLGSGFTDPGGGTITVKYGGDAAGGAPGWIGLSNVYNRRPWACKVRETASSASFSAGSVAPIFGSTGHRVSFVSSLPGDIVDAAVNAVVGMPSNSAGFLGVGLDGASFSGANTLVNISTTNNAVGNTTEQVCIGFHYVQANIYATASGGAGTIYGTGQAPNREALTVKGMF